MPYKGFYPFQRAVQLATLFSQSFSPNHHLSGSSENPNSVTNLDYGIQRLSALSQPFVNPGIIFNSFKSAVAVDYPCYVDEPAGVAVEGWGAMPYIEDSPNYRMPFEAAIMPQAYIPVTEPPSEHPDGAGGIAMMHNPPKKLYFGSNFMYTAPGPTTYTAPYCVWYGNYTPLYSLAANNFFGEIPRFFLAGEKLTTFYSAPQVKWDQFTLGKTYYMDVVLKKTPDMVLSEGQFLSASTIAATMPPARGCGYGPPLSSSFAGSALGSGFPQRDPSFAPWTPPYFYEESIARLAFTPTADGKPTLGELLSKIQNQIDNYNGAPFAYLTDSPANGIIFTGSFSGLDIGVRTDCPAASNKMKLTSSINLFGSSRHKETIFLDAADVDGNYIPGEFKDDGISPGFDVWNISTKFESPALNFSASSPFGGVDPTDGAELGSSASTARGLWGGYGVSPSGSTGVGFQLRESYPEEILKASTTTGSLIQACGFQNTRSKIGRVADTKKISEAIVAIPFVSTYTTPETEPEVIEYPKTYKKFFSINSKTWEHNVYNVNHGLGPEDGTRFSFSITDMIQKMRKYNFPPVMDFMTFKDLNPFVMYIFEFDHVLNKQDLIDIWQGLMPEISRKAEVQESFIEHPSGPKEFFEGKELPEYTRWMVFKVKQKAEKSYFNITADTQDDKRFKFQFETAYKEPEYNYNWPYDFFSLVELAKIEASIEFRHLTN